MKFIWMAYLLLVLSFAFGILIPFARSFDDLGESQWYRNEGLVETLSWISLVFFFTSAILALLVERRAKDYAVLKYVDRHLRIILVVVIAGIFAALRSSSFWFSEWQFVTKAIDLSMILILCYVVYFMIFSLVHLIFRKAE